MGTFITGNDLLPALKTDKDPPLGLPFELDAADINNPWKALDDIRNHVKGWLSIQEYGADPSLADNTPAIQNCITAALATGKGVYIPGANFKVGSSIIGASSLTIRGEGRFSTLVPTITDGSPVIDFPPGSNYFRCSDFCIVSLINGTNFNAGTAQAQQCTGIRVASNIGGAIYSARFSLSNTHVFGCKIGYDIQGFISTCDHIWADYNEIGFKGVTLNTADLNLHLENNRQDFAISDSSAVLLRNIIMEGANTLGVPSTLDNVKGVTMECPYFEASSTAPRTQPWLTVGGISTVYQFRMIGGLVAGANGMAPNIYPIKLDRVVGVEINAHFADGSQTRKVLTTVNTKDYKLSASSDFCWFDDASGQLGPAYNYWPNRRFDLWLRGGLGFSSPNVSTGIASTRSTHAQETIIVRPGAVNALRSSAIAGQNFNHTDFRLTGDIVTFLRGKTVRAGVWLWVPSITEYMEPNFLSYPSVTLSSFNGTVTAFAPTLNHSTSNGAWNFITSQLTIQSDATQIQLLVSSNNSGTNATGNEYVVVGGITLVDASVPFSRQINDNLIDSPLIPSIGINGRLISSASQVPTDTAATFVAGDIVFNNSPLAGEPFAWINIVGGSPGTWRPVGYIKSISADRGDADQTLVVGVDARTQRLATALTANRTITLSTAGAVDGDQFRIVRTGLGAYTLNVGGLKTIPSATAAFVDVAFSGPAVAWVLVGYGLL